MKLSRILYRSYCLFHKVGKWGQQHVTPGGIMVISALGVSCFPGISISKSMVYQAAAFFLMILVVSAIWTLFLPFHPNIKIKRRVPGYAGVNNAFSYEIEIGNRSDTPQSGLVLFEEIHDPRPSWGAFANTPEPYEKKRNIWDRKT